MSKYLKDLNRMIADMWVTGLGGPIHCSTKSADSNYFTVFSGDRVVYTFRWCYREAVEAAIKGAGWHTRHARAMAAGLRKHPIHVKALDATNDLRTVFYFDGKGRARHVQTEAGMNTPAILLYLAYRRRTNRLKRALGSCHED